MTLANEVGRRSTSSGLQLDVLIPVYNEGHNILGVVDALRREVSTPFNILICYDFEEDDTLAALEEGDTTGLSIRLVRNTGSGAHQAVLSGFAASDAPFVLVYPADDDYNAGIVDAMAEIAGRGHDIVCASRFMKGGGMVGCPWIKSGLLRLANFTLYHLARLPTQDASNGFRLFSRRAVDTIVIESDRGFTYSIELLVKCHRLGWAVGDVPAQWFERRIGQSRFRVFEWLPAYLRWYFYAFATTYLRRGPATVPVRQFVAPAGER